MNIKTLLVAVALVACVGTSYAQGFGGGGGRGQGRMMGGQFGRGGGALQLVMRDEVQAELKLTDDQKTKLSALQDEQRAAMRARFQNGGGGGQPDMTKMREEMEKMQKEQQEKIDGILTAEQKTRLQELTIQRAGNGAVNMPDVAKALALTDDQKSKIKALQDQMQEATQSLMEKVRNQEMDFQEVREKMTANQKVMDEKIGEILTDEQKTKLKAMRGAEFKFAADPQRRGGGGGRRGNGN